MRVGILGPLAIEQDGVEVALGGGRLRALLTRLALDAGGAVTTGRLVDALWDGAPPADELHALQSLVSRLRRALGGGVGAQPGGYRLIVEPDDVDAHRFERLAAAGAAALVAHEPTRALTLLREALALWRGPALADVADYRFAAEAARRLDDLRLAALADRIAAELELGEGARLVAELEALTSAQPLHERLAAQLIAALYAAGRQADALAAYERVRARLAEELGAAPSPELQAAHLAVLRGEPGGGRRARRGNLPAPVTSFVGRERELEQIRALLRRGRLVTLIGPGGAGKTRLAREAVAACRDVADGVWMAELAPVTSESEVVGAVLEVFGARELLIERSGPAPPRAALARLLDVVADREAVLVLDNCEHLIGAAAELAERLLAGAPRLRIVATSREPLAIAGEHLAPVPPLELPDRGDDAATALEHPAVRLFADRAAAASPDFAVTDANVADVVEICRRLDGLPLALELAAARLRTLHVGELAARLDDRFRLLTGGSRTALPRHRTLRAVVDWSWELLSEDERVLARRLAVFGAGATLASATAVCGADDALDGLAALVDRSLLGAGPRYRMLETIREYGIERLEEAGELRAVRDAHARYFARLVGESEPKLRGPEQREWFDVLRAERENVLAALRHLAATGQARAALRMAIDLFAFWCLAGAMEDAAQWIALADEAPGDADPDDRLIAALLRRLRDVDYAAADAPELRAALADLATIDDRERPYVAIAKPVLAMFVDPLDATAFVAVLAHPDPWVRAAGHLLRANVNENLGDAAAMDADLDAALTGFTAVGDGWALAMTQTTRSGRLLIAGDLAASEAATTAALAGFDAFAGFAGRALLKLRLSELCLRRGDVDGALAEAAEAVAAGELGGEERLVLDAMLARIAFHADDLQTARARVAGARERLERLPSRGPTRGHARALVMALQARLAVAAGEAGEALLAEALQAAIGSLDQPIVAAVGVVQAVAAVAAGDLAAAGELLGAAAALRGDEDVTEPDVKAVRAALPDDAAYARGRALTREAALERLKRAALVAPSTPEPT